MKRYASLDFLRGVAILMMLSLHITNAYLDKSIQNNLNGIPLIISLMLVILPFFGGLAGFFLLISAISNMISMQKHLQKGKSVRSLLTRQILTGILIVIFGMLAEGLTGYHGTFGKLLGHLKIMDSNTISSDIRKMLYYWNQFETIHTIGWCVILNGIVQATLSGKKNRRLPKKQMAIYLILAFIVVAVTPFVWNLIFDNIVIDGVSGFPWAENPITGEDLFQPVIGESSFGEIILAVFLGPLAGEVEPILPYLAVSFIGSIIGIGLSRPREELPKNFIKKLLLSALVMFLIGLVSTVLVLIQTGGFNDMLNHYFKIQNHRAWEPNYPGYQFPPFAFLAQFLFLNGFSLMGTIIIIYLVEYRGKGPEFAAKTKTVRRFGFIAFTNYNQQWLYYLVAIGFSYITGQDRNYGWFVLVLIGTTLAVYHIIMLLWEKINYIGTIEWWINSLGQLLIPVRRESSKGKRNLLRKGELDVNGAFYDAEWISVYAKDELPAEYWANSLKKIATFGLFSIVFIPFNVLVMIILLRNKSSMGGSKSYRSALAYSIIASALFGVFLIFTSIFTPTMLGLKL